MYMKNKKTVVALGFFDGIHLGHGALLKCARKRADELGCQATLLTFDTHPDTVVRGEIVPLINSPESRMDIVSRLYGIDDVFFIHFNRATMQMDWRDFIQSLTEELHAQHLVIGHDFTCGYKGQGNAENICAYCQTVGLGCDVIEPVKIEGITVSSTYIRKLIADGDMERASKFLGHPHTLVDTVRSGFKLGRTMGKPTINMYMPSNLVIPRRGVYATKVYLGVGDESHISVTNVGVRPTFDESGTRLTVETFILDFDGNLYGQKVRLEFYTFLRSEQKFATPNELSDQIERDAQAARTYFASLRAE
jgi:riboflavin kinase/FMN adenylyltransferase